MILAGSRCPRRATLPVGRRSRRRTAATRPDRRPPPNSPEITAPVVAWICLGDVAGEVGVQLGPGNDRSRGMRRASPAPGGLSRSRAAARARTSSAGRPRNTSVAATAIGPAHPPTRSKPVRSSTVQPAVDELGDLTRQAVTGLWGEGRDGPPQPGTGGRGRCWRRSGPVGRPWCRVDPGWRPAGGRGRTRDPRPPRTGHDPAGPATRLRTVRAPTRSSARGGGRARCSVAPGRWRRGPPWPPPENGS